MRYFQGGELSQDSSQHVGVDFMELDKFISSSLTHIMRGMRKFDQTENQYAIETAQSRGDSKMIETANVFPELSGSSGELSNPNLMKAAQIEGYKGRGTIIAVDYEVLVSVTGDALGVVEASAGASGFFGLKAKYEAKANNSSSQKLSFTIPLELPLNGRKEEGPKKTFKPDTSGIV